MQPFQSADATRKLASSTVLCTLCALSAVGISAAEQPTAAIPLDPVAGILDAFKSHAVVALGEGNHGNEQGHKFRLSLIRDPRFAAAVNDIAVEFGNALYQDTMDRFVSGEEVPYAELRKVWLNTTQAHPVWDVPIYEEFFRTVREVNASLPKAARLRVLLTDAPIDWSRVQNVEDYARQPQRSDRQVVEILNREALAKGRRVLVVYGDMHYLRKNLYYALEDRKAAEERFAAPAGTIVALLERSGVKVLSTWTNTYTDLAALQPNIATWSPPKLTLISGTPIGSAPFTLFNPTGRRELQPDGTIKTIQVDPQRSPSMQHQFDAVLYLGVRASITYSRPSPKLCLDEEYLKLRVGRMKMSKITQPLLTQARQYCAAVAPGSEKSPAFE